MKTTTAAPPLVRDHVTLTPVNVAQGGVACTINTRYDDMAQADIISLRHYPKTVLLYEYD